MANRALMSLRFDFKEAIRCREQECLIKVRDSDNPLERGRWVQHGPNPEHRMFLPDQDVVDSTDEQVTKRLTDWFNACHAHEEKP